ncbi:uncharacterized protein A1O9_02613 [Exophiala aquamarina CBS 119918]|uniref:Ketopantoate reductase N-terminal domain-containing protein n=1 Tax=Exophiala aquamarina CBS 119918 TaxID=1182545 RepID=A0A072PNW8_9EURO|nr:uncharacterized protein A1O9_02613 [Exophiala aquamarina CBS 119918]KEF61048.1 hypothetical protein A1O9_02613 [Exophiala aquamarina CBS 119918]
MGKTQDRHILIVGAGSMGIIMGYILQLSGAEVTFLVRPHRAEALSRPQKLYSYDDHQLKTYTGYKLITSPSEMLGAGYDYVVITLDGAALRNEVGQALVKTIGEAVRGTTTKVIVGTVFIDIRSWFLKATGLESEQVVSGQLVIHIYPTSAVTLPVHAPTDEKLLAQADQAYTDCLGPGMTLGDGSLAAANDFAQLWNASGVSTCNVVSEEQFSLNTSSLFPILAVCELLGWSSFQNLDSTDPLWRLAVAAVKEIQGLTIHGTIGQQAAGSTTDAGIAQVFAGIEKVMLPMDWQSFNRYHHGAKVNAQDRELLRVCITMGEADGKPVAAIKDLLQRVEHHASQA